MFALDPDGTVTTQKAESPAPTLPWLLMTSPYAFLDGLSSQGSPLQPPSGQSMRTPKLRADLSRPPPSCS